MAKVEMHEEVVDMDNGGRINCEALKSGTHQFVVVYENHKWNVEVKKNCSDAFIHRWDYGVNTGSRSDSAANPAFVTLSSKAWITPELLLDLGKVAEAISIIKRYNMETHLDVKEW